MGACCCSSSSSKDAASSLSKTAKYLRRFLACLAIPSALIVIFGFAFLIVGLGIGLAMHWSGFLMGGVFFVACMAAAIVFWDLWGTVSLGLSMFELASCPKEELVDKLQKYNEKKRLGQNDSSVTSDDAIRNMCEGVADTILSKFQMAFQWTPLLFTALAAVCCMLTDVIENAPDEVLIVSTVGVAVGLVASVCSMTILFCILTPIVEGQIKTAFDPYVESLQRTLAEDELRIRFPAVPRQLTIPTECSSPNDDKIHVNTGFPCVSTPRDVSAAQADADPADTAATRFKLKVAGQADPLQVANIV